MLEFQTINVSVHWIYDGEKRLDASFYAQGNIAAKVLIEKIRSKDIEVEKIDYLADRIFWPDRFKRKYVSKKKGSPFLTPSDVFMFLPKARKFIAGFPENALVQDKWLLITRSGSIGRCLISNKLLSNRFILSDDLIRIILKDETNIGYLYAFLNTWIGQAFLTKDQYGATVKHIEPHHVAAIPIPIISEIKEEIGKQITMAWKLREDAQKLLTKAEEMIYSELNLPEIDEDDIQYFGGDKGKIIKSFSVWSSNLSLRFDASYHLPLTQRAIHILNQSTTGVVNDLKTYAYSYVPPRFKRPYVKNSDDGIPLLQGTHIPQIKPFDIKYIWKQMKNLSAYIVKKNWILATSSGTIGRLSLVSDYWDNWAATNHLLRIISDENKIHPGYLTAFLLSIYGQSQFQRLIYGMVVDEIGEAGNLFDDILILKPNDITIENKIGSMVVESYNKRDQANKIENETIKMLEDRLSEIAAGR
jgi:type I restriction enzyme S subunit